MSFQCFTGWPGLLPEMVSGIATRGERYVLLNLLTSCQS